MTVVLFTHVPVVKLLVGAMDKLTDGTGVTVKVTCPETPLTDLVGDAEGVLLLLVAELAKEDSVGRFAYVGGETDKFPMAEPDDAGTPTIVDVGLDTFMEEEVLDSGVGYSEGTTRTSLEVELSRSELVETDSNVEVKLVEASAAGEEGRELVVVVNT